MSEQILCPNCSAPNPYDTVFCGKCGARLATATTQGMEVDPLLGKMVGDRFLVQAKLGEGGMGVVYRAEQTAIGRTVALKVLHPHLSQDGSLHARFQNEAAASSRLTHTNTITIYDFGRTAEGSMYIAMEFIKGRSLDEEIVKGGPIPWQRVLHIGTQICGSLQDAHDNNIVHRDLKPENVMLCSRSGDRDFVKVLDFGIAKILSDDDSGDQRKNLTKTGMVFGTPQYMSPEQIRGEKVDHRSDIYSVGCILYEALAGVLPFTSETPMGVLTKHLIDPPPPLSTQSLPGPIPQGVEAVVMSALAKEASQRPQSMQAFASALVTAGVAAGLSGTALMPATTAGQPPTAGPLSTTALVTPTGLPSAAAATNHSGPAPSRVGNLASSSTPSGPSGAVLGILIATAVVILAGAGLGWYFLLGPGAAAPDTQVAVTPPELPPVGPAGPAAYQPAPYTPPTPTGSLPAVPVDAVKPETPKHTGGGTKPKVPTDKVPADAACNYTGSGDPVAGVMSANLRRQEAKVKACVTSASSQTAIGFEVQKGSAQLEKLQFSRSSEMDGCLRPIVASSLTVAADANRTGTATFVLGRDKGAVFVCTIKVDTKTKPSGPTFRPIEIKPQDGDKPKPQDGDKPKPDAKDKDKDKTKDTDGSGIRRVILKPIKAKGG